MTESKENVKSLKERFSFLNPGPNLLMLTIILGGLFILYEVLKGIYHLLLGGSDTAKIVVAGSVTIFVAIFSAVFTKLLEQKNAIKADLRAKKTPIYQNFIDFTLSTMFDPKIDTKEKEIKISAFFVEFTPRLILWGTDDVLKAYLKFRNFCASEEYKDEPTRILIIFEKVVLSMRVDLGHKNKNINSGDILTTFITDPESLKALLSKE